jgi:hypothetical protein
LQTLRAGCEFNEGKVLYLVDGAFLNIIKERVWSRQQAEVHNLNT